MIKKLIKFYFLIFIIIFIISSLLLLTLSKYAGPTIINYVNYEAKKSSIEVLRNTGLSKINDLLDKNNIYEITKNSKGEIDSIDFNIPVLNEILIIVAKETRNKLREENKKNIVKFIPLGVASNNTFLNNTGIKVPVKVEYDGTVGLDLKTRVKPYGVDSALVEVYIRVEVSQVSMIPFLKNEQKVVSDVPVVIKIIKGAQTGVLIDKSSNYSLPIN